MTETAAPLKDFGSHVKRRREIAAGSPGVRQFAARLGISPATLSRIERGHDPDIRTFFKVCQALWVEPGFFTEQFAAQPLNPKETVE